MTIPDDVKEIMQSLTMHGYDAFVIGGAVRDIVMNVSPHDWDIFTNATGDEILSIFPNGKVIGGEERQAKILTVVVQGVEISQYRANGDRTKIGLSLYKHLNTCDFTMNAIAMDINGVVIDPHFGIIDIQNKEITCVGNADDRIQEDKLRVFRAVRFSLRFNFDITTKLMNTIKNTSVADLPVERIREEVLKILMYPGGLETLQKSGLLTKIIREFWYNVELKGGSHHNEDVDTHMYNAQDVACGITDNPVLVFACALHDIGKGTSYQRKEDGSLSFHGHERVGADIIRDVMKRMRFSNDDIKYVVALIDNHLVNYDDGTTDKAYVKRFKKLEDAGVSIGDYMVMLYADNQSNMKNERVKFGDFVNGNKILEKYYELKFSSMPFGIEDLDITGYDIMNVGIPAGPEIGEELGRLFELVVNGEVENTFRNLIREVNK
jgi:tRNA nucleotidyltransferase (CCA-adding enzyme)